MLVRNQAPWLAGWRSGLLIVVALVAVDPQSGASLADGPGEPRSGRIEVEVEHGRLRLNAHDVPLGEILGAIARQAGLRLVLRGDLDDRISRVLPPMPLETGIRRLIGRHGLVMIYGSTRNRDDARGLVEVRVYGDAGDQMMIVEPPTSSDPLNRIYDGLTRRDRMTKLRRVRELQQLDKDIAVDDLALVLALEDDTVIRRVAAVGLGKIGGRQAMAALSEALQDESAAIRRQVVRALAAIGTEAAAAVALSNLNDQDPEVRIQVLRALRSLPPEEAVAALHAVVVEDPHPDVRRKSIAVLANLRSEGARWALEIAASDSDPAVRQAADAALWRRR